MKILNRHVAAVCGLLALALGTGAVQAREFTQKDTGKTLQGKVMAVSAAAGTVTMRVEGNRTITFKQDLLVEEDVTYLTEWAEKYALASRVSLSATRVAGERTKEKSGEIYEYRTEEAGFRISIRNTGNGDSIPEIPIKWQMVVTRSNGNTEVIHGSDTVKFLSAGSTKDLSTELVKLRTSCKSLSSCPKCVDHASEFKGERLEGILIELTDEDGEAIQELVSPSMRESRIREAIDSKSGT